MVWLDEQSFGGLVLQSLLGRSLVLATPVPTITHRFHVSVRSIVNRINNRGKMSHPSPMWSFFIFATAKTNEVSTTHFFRLAGLLGVPSTEPPCFPVALSFPFEVHGPLIGKN